MTKGEHRFYAGTASSKMKERSSNPDGKPKRAGSEKKRASSQSNSERYNRLFNGTTASSKNKERPAFNLDTRINYEDVPNTKAPKKPADRDDYGKAWTESLRS